MSVIIKLDMHEGALSVLRKYPSEFADELKLAASVKWYEMCIISHSIHN